MTLVNEHDPDCAQEMKVVLLVVRCVDCSVQQILPSI